MNAKGSLLGSQLSLQPGTLGPVSQRGLSQASALHTGAVEMPFAPGHIISGKYEVIDLIGSGGMGYVVSARHIDLGELVAIKFLRSEALAYEELVARFDREARASVRIKSEHVARVYDVGTLPNGVPFIVMEHLEGKDLGEVLQEQGRLPIKTAIDYVMQACEALASAHAVNIVHRDVKPENLFLTRQGQGVDMLKVLDFGISKVALESAMGPRRFVKTTMPLGSPVYMSPEQIRNSENVDVRTDIWSLGCVLFELLTGATAFDAPSLMELGAAILSKEPVMLRTLLPEAPPELEAIVHRCLEKDANKRFDHIAELGIALYPFAPRRARICAERCQTLLRSTDPNAAGLELFSIAPPSSAMTAEARNFPTLAGAAPLSANTGVTLDAKAEAEPEFRPKRIGLKLLLAASVLGGVGYTYTAGVKQGNSESAAASAAVVEAQVVAKAPVPALPKAPEAETAVKLAPVEVGTEASKDDVQAPSQAANLKPPTPSQAVDEARNKRPRYVRPVPVIRIAPPPPKPAPAAKPKSHPSDEPDVGF